MKLDGAIDLADYGVFMEPGRDAEGNLMRDALFFVREELFLPFVERCQAEAVLGVRVLQPPGALAVCGFALVTARVKIEREGYSILVFTVNQAGAQVFGVLAKSAMEAMKWPTKPPSRLIVPGEA